MTDTPENNDQSPEAIETVAERPRKTLTLGGSRAPVEAAPEPEVEAEEVAEIVNDDTGVDTTADDEDEDGEPIVPNGRITLQELKDKTPADLLAFAESLEIENANTMRKQDMMFAILKTLADEGVEIIGSGTLEVLPDGFGFLRSPDANYLPGPDDIYVAPRRSAASACAPATRSTAPSARPRDGERYFALVKVDTINFEDPENVRHKVHLRQPDAALSRRAADAWRSTIRR